MQHILCNVNQFLGKIQKYFAFLPSEVEKSGFFVIFPPKIVVLGVCLSGHICKTGKGLQSWGQSCLHNKWTKKSFFQKKGLTGAGKALYLYYMK
jgi:hypothetical protein